MFAAKPVLSKPLWLSLSALLLIIGLLLGSGILSATAAPTGDPMALKQARYTIWGTISDAAGEAPEGAKVRVYRRNPITDEFFGIDGPEGIYIYPDEDGVWSVEYDGAEDIEWLVVRLFYEPGWAGISADGPEGSIIDEQGQRIDLPRPGEGTLGPFSYVLQLPPTATPIPPTLTPTPEETMPTVEPPTPTLTPTPEETLPARHYNFWPLIVKRYVIAL